MNIQMHRTGSSRQHHCDRVLLEIGTRSGFSTRHLCQCLIERAPIYYSLKPLANAGDLSLAAVDTMSQVPPDIRRRYVDDNTPSTVRWWMRGGEVIDAVDEDRLYTIVIILKDDAEATASGYHGIAVSSNTPL